MNVQAFLKKYGKYISIAIFICVYLYRYLKKKVQPYPYLLGDQEVVGQVESFTNSNIIKNGSFNHGENIGQLTDQQGDNKIVVFANPSNSSHVLRQSGKNTYYKLSVNVEPSKYYTISLMVFTTPEWNGQDKLFNIVLYNNKNKNIIYSSNGKVKSRISTNNASGSRWNLMTYTFRTISDSNGKAAIYLGYKPNATLGYRYITDVQMNQVLENSVSFPVTSGLKSFVNAGNKASFNGYNTVWKDLSGNGNDFHWSTKPTWNVDGYFETVGKTLTGPTTNKIGFSNENGNNFTLVMRFSTNEPVKALKKDFSKEKDEHDMAVSIKGNKKDALKIYFPKKYGFIKLVIADKAYRTNINILPTDKNTYAFAYVGNAMNIYVNEVLVDSQEIDNIYFKNDNVLINPDKTWDANLYTIAIFNRGLRKDEVSKVVQYNSQLVCDSNKTTDVGGYVFQDPLTDSYVQRDDINQSDFLTGDLEPETDSNSFVQQKCRPEYQGKNCQWINRDGKKVCGFMKDSDLFKCDDGCCSTTTENQSDSDQEPTGYMRGNEIIIYIPANSRWSSVSGWGEKSYGTDIDMARKLYKRNYPDCRIPDVLSKYSYKPSTSILEKCPFIVGVDNPCNCYDCHNVDWKAKDVSKMSDKCKKQINHYCEKNNKVDPNCMCWKPEFRKMPQCVKFRRDFVRDDTCTADSFNIDQHPDYKNYIRKDKIPCWGCNP